MADCWSARSPINFRGRAAPPHRSIRASPRAAHNSDFWILARPGKRECAMSYFAAGIHVVLVLSYMNPGAVFKASLVVFKTKYHLLFFSLA